MFTEVQKCSQTCFMNFLFYELLQYMPPTTVQSLSFALYNLLLHTGYLVIRSSRVWKDTFSEDNCTYSGIQAGTIIILPSVTCSDVAVWLCTQVQLINGPEVISKYLGESEKNLRFVTWFWPSCGITQEMHVRCDEVGILLLSLYQGQVLFSSVK